jgi:hypothetical protein
MCRQRKRKPNAPVANQPTPPMIAARAFGACRGPPWNRTILATPSGGNWFHSLMAEFGPFEMIDLSNELGIEPIITLCSCGLPPSSFADLVEYCWAGANTTWGAQRVADGHPRPFRVRWFELGNEEYNKKFAATVEAMEAKATSLGMARTLYYMSPGGALRPEDVGNLSQLGLGEWAITPTCIAGLQWQTRGIPSIRLTEGLVGSPVHSGRATHVHWR